MNFVTFAHLSRTIVRNIHKIPRDLDLVVGIPRSGSLVAYMIGLVLNIPIVDLGSFISNQPIGTGTTRKKKEWITQPADARHILLVDDSISTGEAMKSAKNMMTLSGLKTKITTCAAYALPTNFFTVDCYFEICNHPRMFEWNFMHHWGLQYACVDIDGVLCLDPGIVTSQIESRYQEFLENATPKIIPTQKIGYLVTSRREKYRTPTERWLDRQKIEYDHLLMLESDNEEIMTNKNYGIRKGEVYRNTNCFIFIESNQEQAMEICRISQKQVFCTETHELISPESLYSMTKIAYNDYFITLKRVVKKVFRMGKRYLKAADSDR